ncbi:hypothetical protein C8R45DRAFT_1032322 [Mycena sanguinolenta]|nr:hypothetical protein C8R45DRAFT_1032322 [Mycena sanguinolenta]
MSTRTQRRLSRAGSVARRISGLWLFKSSRTSPISEPNVLPTEVFLEIANHLTRQELVALSSCSSELRRLLRPEIYSALSGLCGSRACSEKLQRLSTTPEIWTYLRKLEIGTDWLSWPIKESVECHVASTLENIFPGLTNLETFTWVSIYPLQETFWGALRASCPNLRNLSYTAQIREFQPDSELFKFRNLCQFSLCVEYKAEAPPLIQSSLPPQLCDMLLQNSDLEHLLLRLCYSYHDLQSLSQVLQGTWSKLRSFHIELCAQHPARDHIASFLAAHSSIESLTIFVHDYTEPLPVSHITLPHLESFSGLSQHISVLSNADRLGCLILADEPITHPSRVLAALSHLTSLTSLTISIANAGNISTLSNILDTCWKLESLSVSYLTPCSTKQLKAVVMELSRLPNLSNFSLTKAYRASDGTMLAAVLILLARNPGLREIHMMWIGSEAWKQSGDYEIISSLNDSGKRVPEFVDANEFGFGTRGKSFSRGFRYGLVGGDKVAKGLAKIRR